MKWEPLAAMTLVLALGLWLVWGPFKHTGLPELRDNAHVQDLRIGPIRGVIETAPPAQQTGDPAKPNGPGQPTFRLLDRDGHVSPILTADDLAAILGDDAVDEILATNDNWAFRLFQITGWAGLAWVLLGLAGQAAFFGRMAVQWVISERERRSVVPPIFWYLSFLGGVALFTYFVWRQDFVGVLGQSTGVVIYARNIRLIFKQRRRDRRAGQRSVSPEPPAPEAPDSPPAPDSRTTLQDTPADRR